MRIFTFGVKQTYTGENQLQVLLDFIKEYCIDVVIDVRYNRGNRFKKWVCNGNHIEQAINQQFTPAECHYVAFPHTGISPKIRKKYGQCPRDLEVCYYLYLLEHRDEILSFFRKYSMLNVVLLCVENLKNPKTPFCHRRWLAFWLKDYGIAEEVVEETV